MGNKEKTLSCLKIAIIILAGLIVLSITGIAARYIYLSFYRPEQSTVTIPYNLIGKEDKTEKAANFTASGNIQLQDKNETKATFLELYKNHSTDNEKFEIKDMLPGDTVTRYFCIKAYHDINVNLIFKPEVTAETNGVGKVMHIKVTEINSGTVICEAPLSEISGNSFSFDLKENENDESVVYYQVDVSMDTSAGNEYQLSLLKANLNWYIEGENGLTPPPSTGDSANTAMWVVMIVSSILMVITFLLSRRGKGEHQNG